MSFTLRQLEIFETVARLASFMPTVEELQLRRLGVSMSIRQLDVAVAPSLAILLQSAGRVS